MKGPIGWFVAGGVAGVVGGAIWAAVPFLTGFEIGWIAWGIGLAVGAAVRAIDDHGGVMRATCAALIAALAVAGGKFVAVSLILSDAGSQAVAEMRFDDEFVKTFIADDIVTRKVSAGEQLVWPEHSAVMQTGETAEDYPADVWEETEYAWGEFSKEERDSWREAARRMTRENVRAYTSSLNESAFLDSFALWDLLWFFLAVGTAFKLAGTEE